MSSLEWAHESMDSIRVELGSLRSEMADVRVELGVARAAQNASKTAELEAQLAEALHQIENTKDATKYNAEEIDNMKKQVGFHRFNIYKNNIWLICTAPEEAYILISCQ